MKCPVVGNCSRCYYLKNLVAFVFGYRTIKISHPVHSAVNKHRIDWLVLQWMAMWESQFLNSFFCLQFGS